MLIREMDGSKLVQDVPAIKGKSRSLARYLVVVLCTLQSCTSEKTKNNHTLDALPPQTPVNRLCGIDGKLCTICAAQAMCWVPPSHRSNYVHCLKVTTKNIGFITSSCSDCQCKALTADQSKVFQPQVLTRQNMYYHLHISKTGGTTFEQYLRKRIAPVSGLKMCDEALKTSFKLPFKHAPYFATPENLKAAQCHMVSAEGKRVDIAGQFKDMPEPKLLVWLRDPLLRTWSQWNHDKSYNIKMPARANLSHDHQLLQKVPKDLLGVYDDAALDASLHERYGNWQFYRLCKENFPHGKLFLTHSSYVEVKESLASHAFLGLSDHFRTSLCLFYYTFGLLREFASCDTRQLHAYNAACYANGSTNKLCVGGAKFTNKFGLGDASEQIKRDQLRVIPESQIQAIRRHTHLDNDLYNTAVDIFWRRVAVMQAISGVNFTLPRRYT
eukprot:m.16481 g.16481  ORF g.16481 m.16481 type:complete len:441 (+) comp10968_c0_seq1:249-1571(+)